MRLNATDARNYYGPNVGGPNQTPPAASSITASGSASQSASGNVSLLANPGLGAVVLVAIVFLILHRGGISKEG